MPNRFVLHPFLFILGLASLPILIEQVQAQESSKLLPGKYVYLGKQAGSTPPKYVTVADDGSIHWDGEPIRPTAQAPKPLTNHGSNNGSANSGDDDGEGINDVFGNARVHSANSNRLNKAKDSHAPKPMAMTPVAQLNHSSISSSNAPPAVPPKGEFEEYKYPRIKWKPKMLASGAVVQMETMMDEQSASRSGQLKYIIHVLVKGAALVPSSGLHIDILDEQGFSLLNFVVPASSLSLVPGTKVMQCRGTTFLRDVDYRKAADYSVN